MSIRPLDNQVAMARTPEVAAERARDIRQTGLTTGTLNEIAKDSEEDSRGVQDKYETEMVLVRPEDDGENAAERDKREKEEPPEEDEDENRRRLASESLLNLSVTGSGNKELVSKRFDIKV